MLAVRTATPRPRQRGHQVRRYWAVRRCLVRLRKTKGVQAEDVSIIVDTEAGEVAQVDFGYVGKLLDPDQHVMRKAWVFVMILGYM